MSDSDSLGSLLDSSSDDDELLVNINNKVKEDAAVPQRVVVPLPNPARNVASATAKDENGGFNAKEREWILKNFYFKKDDKKFYCDACSLGFNLANTPLDKCDASFTGGNASRKYRHIRNDHGVTPEMLQLYLAKETKQKAKEAAAKLATNKPWTQKSTGTPIQPTLHCSNIPILQCCNTPSL